MGSHRELSIAFSGKGQTLVIVSLVLVVLLAFVGIVVDLGYMYVTKGQLQNAADAAALAGAGRLDGSSFSNQTSARNTAVRFALANKAAATPVQISEDLTTNQLLPTNDIQVGFWDGTTFNPSPDPTGLPSTNPINAVLARARRTGASDAAGQSLGGQVDVFFGRVLAAVGLTHWSKMSAVATAVAVRQPLMTPGLTICIQTCDPAILQPPISGNLILQKDPKSQPLSNGIAWTAFNCAQAPNIGTNGDVIAYINGRAAPSPLCNTCITTNNGVGQALQALAANYSNPNFDAANKITVNGVVKWTVATVVVDGTCQSCTNPALQSTNGCPPGGQGSTEPYHISGFAAIEITSVNTGGSTKGITIDDIHCVPCPAQIPLGKGVALVR